MNKKFLTKITASILSAALVVGMLPTSVLAESDVTGVTGVTPIAGDDGDYVNMSFGQVLSLDLSQKEVGYSVSLYDNGGSASSYQSNSNDFLQITIPEGKAIEVSGMINSENNFDYLCFYDGLYENQDSLPYSYEKGYCGKSDIEWRLFTNTMTVYFHSDGSVTYPGFNVKLTVVDVVPVTFKATDDNQVVIDAKEGAYNTFPDFESIFESPDSNIELEYWSDGEREYAPDDMYLPEEGLTFTAVCKNKPCFTLDGDGQKVKLPRGGQTIYTSYVNTGYYFDEDMPVEDVFELPENKVFGGYQVNGGDEIIPSFAFYPITEDTTFKAVWKEYSDWDDFAEDIYGSEEADLGTIVLEEDLVAEYGSYPITVPAGITLTIDLNGHKIDGSKIAAVGGYALDVRGKLSIIDTAGGGEFVTAPVRVLDSADTSGMENILSEYKATISRHYYYYSYNDNSNESSAYDHIYIPELKDALEAPLSLFRFNNEDQYIIESLIPSGYEWNGSGSAVVLLDDATLPRHETWTIKKNYIDIDLNGYEFNVEGTLESEVTNDYYYYYNSPGVIRANLPSAVLSESPLESLVSSIPSGVGALVRNPLRIPVRYDEEYYSQIDFIGENPGVFNSSGILDVQIDIKSDGVYSFTDGAVLHDFYVYAGEVSISDTELWDDLRIENESKNDISAMISGDTTVPNLYVDIDNYDTNATYVDISIADTAKISDAYIDVAGDSSSNPHGVVELSGGYFSKEPSDWIEGGDYEDYLVINGTEEPYTDQDDWAVDAEAYGWRVSSDDQITNRITRLYGDSRFETSLESATELKAQLGLGRFDSVVVACGTSFPDALAGSYLATSKAAPVLLTGKNYYELTADYIKNNLSQGGTIYILGGTGAVPEEFEELLAGTTYKIKRLAGSGRLETNLEILEASHVNPNSEYLVCTADTFADSLSASAAGIPILLVSKKLSDEQKEFLSKHGDDNTFYLIGGTGAVSKTIESELAAYGTTERVAGDTRFETSLAVAERFFDEPHKLVFAYSENFPDGLSAGPLAAVTGSPLILTLNNDKWNKVAVNYSEENKLAVREGFVLGGPSLISDAYAMNIINPLD
ncbi:MAG: cell wall-binding repeat-containing protein [Lachnospiraceae bacterium]|nr:cell wall-binding repeat-containing protein [Lachnospiraceae bacterium]